MRKEEIITKLNNQLNKYKAMLDAWQKVKRLRKKDGSDFVIKGKNIEGARYGAYCPNEDYMHPYLTISYHYNGYNTDSLGVFEYIDNFKSGDARLDNKDQIISNGFGRSTYILNLDETFEAINDYIKYLKEIISSYEKQIQLANNYIEQVDKLIQDINKFAKDENLKNGIFGNTLGYSLIDYIKSSI